MRNISEVLRKKQIINDEKIKEIKNWIEEHYRDAPKEKKAKILARKIHQMIDQNLPSFSKETKTNIRMQLINEHLTSRSLTINAKNIVDSSVEHASREEIKRNLFNWLDEVEHIDRHLIDQYVLFLYSESEMANDEIAATYTIDTPIVNEPNDRTTFEKKMPYIFGTIAVALLLIIIPFTLKLDSYPMDNVVAEEIEIKDDIIRTPNELPAYLQYQTINEDRLRAYLQSRNSLLVEEPYFSTIIGVADEFNVHPLLLFAITGQEQGFVPMDDKDAHLIANNPYNVFYSWQEYNTDILDASEIAARTIVNLSENRPENVDPIQWINRKYAEDQNWWKGVSELFQELTAYVES